MQFLADLHVHSKYSRATAANLDLENLYIAAQVKGITLIGTGDFTHPAWWGDIQEKLVSAEEGLFQLRSDLARHCDQFVPASCRRPVRFMLATEISNIYKKDDRTRKNHNLVFMPTIESAERLIRRLDAIGNIVSDGRPILGLDARNLLEIVLETHDQGFLIPAHIWTPWFSLLGSKSGFDAVEACFGDLTDHIFALETGLSSDPPMNRRVSALDRYTLISNSDAHSPSKIGREANCFDTALNYPSIYDAMRTADPEKFLGTIEFYPEEGKYHVDGHRKCGFHCFPEETRRLQGLCPHCGKPLTLGVLYRVEELADRPKTEVPADSVSFSSLIPLTDLLSEVLDVGPATKTVKAAYGRLIQAIGPEFEILCNTPLEALEACCMPLLGEAIRRMRKNDLSFDPGFDGQFGRLRIFKSGERQDLYGQQCLFGVNGTENSEKTLPRKNTKQLLTGIWGTPEMPAFTLNDPPKPYPRAEIQLNADQRRAVDAGTGPLLIRAGPGTGKTCTITCRMAALLDNGITHADQLLAVTFTHQAAAEMRHRLETMLKTSLSLPRMTTFHGFCLHLLKEVYGDQCGTVLDESGRLAMVGDAVAMVQQDGHSVELSPVVLLDGIVQAKQQLRTPRDLLNPLLDTTARVQTLLVYEIYQELLKIQNLYDYEDLLVNAVDLLENDPGWRNTIRHRYRYIFVDEFQDINMAQYRLLQAIAPPGSNLCVIGDPDQAIYAFRGSDSRYFEQFSQDYPDLRSISLERNYRSTETILQASVQALHQGSTVSGNQKKRIYSGIDGIPYVTILETGSERAEAAAIGRIIEQMVGGTGFHSVDFGKVATDTNQEDCSFEDFAVLTRTGRQARFVFDKLTAAGIPAQLALKHTRDTPAALKLMAAMRTLSGKGAYCDLDGIAGLSGSGISKETLSIFKQWAYGKQLRLSTALRSAKRIPIPGMSQRRQIRLAALCDFMERLGRETKEMGIAQAMAHIVANTTLANRIDAEQLDKVVSQALRYGHPSELLTDKLALEHDADRFQSGIEKVAVMTLHASKGLEFSTVFVAGCEDGLIPYEQPGQKMRSIEEERRLFYVAMTRAKQTLFLTWARRRTINGKTARRQASPFMMAIEEKLKYTGGDGVTTRKYKQEQLLLF
jgi:DNA helicase-2/ATP-dependent DNA helicase PcrA